MSEIIGTGQCSVELGTANGVQQGTHGLTFWPSSGTSSSSQSSLGQLGFLDKRRKETFKVHGLRQVFMVFMNSKIVTTHKHLLR